MLRGLFLDLMRQVTLAILADGFSLGLNTTVPVKSFQSITIFNYTPFALILPYTVGFGLAAICCLSGLLAVCLHNAGGNPGFKQFLSTTRHIDHAELEAEGKKARVFLESVDEDIGEGFVVAGGSGVQLALLHSQEGEWNIRQS